MYCNGENVMTLLVFMTVILSFKELPEDNIFSCQHGEPECYINIVEVSLLANNADYSINKIHISLHDKLLITDK